MKWSPQQDHALKRVDHWLSRGGDQVFRLFGYAGTGKTTLARHLGMNVDNVRFAAYTGKAAHVLHQKGCYGASTLHSLIYTPKGKNSERLRALQVKLSRIDLDPETGKPPLDLMIKHADLKRQIKKENDNLKSPSFSLNVDSILKSTDLLVIDECSMVDVRMGDDLLSFDCKVLVLGDPAQLPPVRGGGFFTDHEPDVMLTEIHRQAAGNPIIRLATQVREGGGLALGKHGDSLVTYELTPELALSADQIIVGRNKTRHGVNARMRELLGYTGVAPNVGERLVCLRNNHELGLLNGSIWNVEEVHRDDDPMCLSLSPEGEDWTQELMVHRAPFEGRDVMFWEKREAEEFCPGYVLTCHKSQGSQWPRVLVLDESEAFRSDQRRWLYTAITRASESVVVRL